MTALYVALWFLAGLLAAVWFHWIERKDAPNIVWFMVAVLTVGGAASLLTAAVMALAANTETSKTRNPFYGRT